MHFTTFEYFLKTTSVDGLIQIHSFFNVRIKNSRTYELLVTKKFPEVSLLFGHTLEEVLLIDLQNYQLLKNVIVQK